MGPGPGTHMICTPVLLMLTTGLYIDTLEEQRAGPHAHMRCSDRFELTKNNKLFSPISPSTYKHFPAIWPPAKCFCVFPPWWLPYSPFLSRQTLPTAFCWGLVLYKAPSAGIHTGLKEGRVASLETVSNRNHMLYQ